MSHRRPAVRGTLSLLGAAALTLVSSPAWAHVEVEASRAQAGATHVDLTFHVPNEESAATTRSLTFIFPTDHPLLGVTTARQNGFTPKVSTVRLAKAVQGPNGMVNEVVRSVEFSGGQLSGTDRKAFTFHVDQLPTDTRTLTFKALQKYNTGETVSWIEVAADGAAEPDYPAPMLFLDGPAKTAHAPHAGSSEHPLSPKPAARVSAAPVTAAGVGSGKVAPVTAARVGSGTEASVTAAAIGSSTASPVVATMVGGLVVVVLGWALWQRRRALGDAS